MLVKIVPLYFSISRLGKISRALLRASRKSNQPFIGTYSIYICITSKCSAQPITVRMFQQHAAGKKKNIVALGVFLLSQRTGKTLDNQGDDVPVEKPVGVCPRVENKGLL